MSVKTRSQKYAEKLSKSKTFNVSMATVSIHNDNNTGFAIRTVACFGMKNLYVIGAKPDRSIHNGLSGSTFDLVNIVHFENNNQFLTYCSENNIQIISAELSDDSINLYDFSFDVSDDAPEIVILIGNESFGVPAEIMLRSTTVFIPMNGCGVCLNTVVAGTAIVNEYFRQLYTKNS
jgi:tRNA G18 (ribose-2'-O)-methylase SpoU